MSPVTATDFRKNMFSFLDQVEQQKKPFSFKRKGKVFNVSVGRDLTSGRFSCVRGEKENPFERMKKNSVKSVIIGNENIDDINWIAEWSAGSDL